MNIKLANVRNSFFSIFFSKIRLYYLYRILLTKLGFQNPFVNVMKITSACNLSCLHCPWKKDKLQTLPITDFKIKIDKSYGLGCECVIFEGGEPTLNNDLGELIEYAKQKKMLTILITNGQQDFSMYSPDSIWVSVEGTEEAQDKIRGVGTYSKLKENILKSTHNNIVVLMSISKSNKDSIDELPVEFENYYVWYNFIYPYKNIKTEQLDPHEIIQTSNRILQLKKKYNNIINSKSYLKNVGRKVCCNPWWTYTVSFDGKDNIGCTVEQIEKCDCISCYLACYAEPYHLLNLKSDSIRFIKKISGMKSIFR